MCIQDRGSKARGVRKTKYEQQIQDLELFIPKEGKRRGHRDVVKYLEYFCVERGEGSHVSHENRTEYK